MKQRVLVYCGCVWKAVVFDGCTIIINLKRAGKLLGVTPVGVGLWEGGLGIF